MFGAHLDHVGYNATSTSTQPVPGLCRQRGQAAQAALREAGKTPVNTGRGRGDNAGPAESAASFETRDTIYNGADDDGSGSAAELAIAKAFATGPKPRRSLVFVWHAGEESDLLGSLYNADFPVVPLDKVQAMLNIDMVGRDDCNNMEGDYTNTLFVVGADRISTDLHNAIVAENRMFANPLTLDYELNDPSDPEIFYTRSDHFSYAAKGVPIVFFTTGLHPDYHRPSDTVDKILFPKMARIARLIYRTGYAIADSASALERDRKGSRTGFGSKAEILPK
jgi:Zn-dependent M28 family amino/carboxypeptidase